MTEQQIESIYNNEFYLEQNEYLEIQYNFNEGSGSPIVDLSGNGKNGTINGATWGTETYSQNSSGVDSSFSVNVEPLIDGEVTLINKQ